jgi:Mu-like prophage I protein
MATLLSLTKDREDALKALNAATTSASKGKAAAAFEKATLALAAFNAKLEAKNKSKDSPVDEEEEDSEDAEEEGGEEEEMDDEEEEDEYDDSDDDSDDDDDDDDEEEESAKSRSAALKSAESVVSAAKKTKNKSLIAAAKASLESVQQALAAPRAGATLRAAVEKVTGKKGTRAQLGALDGLAATAQATTKLTADVAKMKSATRKDHVNAMLSTARREGRIVKSESDHLRAMGMQDPKRLKSYLSVRPKMVRTSEDGALEGRTLSGGKDGDAPRADAIDSQKLSAEERKIVEAAGAGTGLEFDAFVEAMNQTRAKISGKGKKL